jgi:transposase
MRSTPRCGSTAHRYRRIEWFARFQNTEAQHQQLTHRSHDNLLGFEAAPELQPRHQSESRDYTAWRIGPACTVRREERIKDVLPGREGHVGGTAEDNRLFVEAVLYRFRTGCPWRDLPERFGHWKAVHQRFGRWAKSGVFERVLALLASDHDNERSRFAARPRRVPCKPLRLCRQDSAVGPRRQPLGGRPFALEGLRPTGRPIWRSLPSTRPGSCWVILGLPEPSPRAPFDA